jgi:hypothetical protein
MLMQERRELHGESGVRGGLCKEGLSFVEGRWRCVLLVVSIMKSKNDDDFADLLLVLQERRFEMQRGA